jgi:plastocyanin
VALRVAFIAALGAASCGAVAAATHTVTIAGMHFNPDSLTVASGDAIVWVNKDLVAHTVTEAGGHAFDSHEIAPQASWTYVARKPGRYPYGCTLHPAMKATLIVKGKP